MAEKRDIITKGIYKHAQMSGFVSVKQYIFLNKNGKRCLMLRFFNDMDVSIDEMSFTVEELDANGSTIKSSRVHYSGVILPGYMFSSDDAVTVDGKCCDFRVSVDSVRSGEYEYRAAFGKLSVRYAGRIDAMKPKSVSVEEYEKMSRKKPIRTGIFKLIAIVLLIAMIAANFIFVFVTTDEPITDESESTAESLPQTSAKQRLDFTRSRYVEIR